MAKDSQEAANVLQTINVIKKDTASKIKMQVQTQNQAQNAGSSTSKGFPNKSIKSSASKTHAGMPVVPTNMIHQMTVGGMGVSKNAKKADSLDHQVDSLKVVISDLQRDTAKLAQDTHNLHEKIDELHAKIASDSEEYEKNISDLLNANKDLSKDVKELQEHQSPIVALTSPSGCAVLIVLIIALTVIAIKKGVSISKGNTSISVGDNKK